MDSANWEHWWLPNARFLEEVHADDELAPILDSIEGDLVAEHLDAARISDILSGVSKVLSLTRRHGAHEQPQKPDRVLPLRAEP